MGNKYVIGNTMKSGSYPEIALNSVKDNGSVDWYSKVVICGKDEKELYEIANKIVVALNTSPVGPSPESSVDPISLLKENLCQAVLDGNLEAISIYSQAIQRLQ